MAKIDMHVHSKYSERPSDWFLQRIGAKESYTEPTFIYQTAKKRGMNFITITDHNRMDGALILKEEFPEDVIVGVETTTYFPEDGCKAHVLLYGIDTSQFAQIQKIRESIYTLRDYIKSEKIAYSLAHATYPINGKLTVGHIEKLILLFDVFEGINGGRNNLSNQNFMEMMKNLTPAHLENLYTKHGIEPMSDTPWIKAFTGGSDDHSGQFIGKTFTNTDADNIEDILHNIRSKRTSPEGRHNDFKSLAFAVYKIAYDFSKTKGNEASNTLFQKINENLFDSKSLKLKDRLMLRRAKSHTKKKGARTSRLLIELIEEARKINPLHIDEQLDLIYEKTAEIADEFFKKILSSIERDIATGDIVNVILNVSSSIPGLFLSLPFFSALKHMFHSRMLVNQIQKALDVDINGSEKRILWFADTINGTNGLSATIQEWGWKLHRNKRVIKLVTSNFNESQKKSLPPDVIFLPTFFDTKIMGHEKARLWFPSVLKSLDILQREEPTEVFISTPGPVGLLGLLVARLLNIKTCGIYETDFMAEINSVVDDPAIIEITESYARWFYSKVDTIMVRTAESIHRLEARGLERTKLQLMPIGKDQDIYSAEKNARPSLSQ